MSSRIVSLVIDAADPVALAQFWAQALGREVKAVRWQQTPYGPSGATIALDDALGLELDFQWVPDPRPSQKNRLHLDMNPTDRNQADELARLLALGARPVDVGQGGVSWVVLADPEGNVFCLCRDRIDPLPSPKEQ
jgi:hypothetical protein